MSNLGLELARNVFRRVLCFEQGTVGIRLCSIGQPYGLGKLQILERG